MCLSLVFGFEFFEFFGCFFGSGGTTSPFKFVSTTVFAEFLEDRQPDEGEAGREGELGERVPEVFAEGGGDGFLAVERDLGEGCVVP